MSLKQTALVNVWKENQFNFAINSVKTFIQCIKQLL